MATFRVEYRKNMGGPDEIEADVAEVTADGKHYRFYKSGGTGAVALIPTEVVKIVEKIED